MTRASRLALEIRKAELTIWVRNENETRDKIAMLKIFLEGWALKKCEAHLPARNNLKCSLV